MGGVRFMQQPARNGEGQPKRWRQGSGGGGGGANGGGGRGPRTALERAQHLKLERFLVVRMVPSERKGASRRQKPAVGVCPLAAGPIERQ